MTTTVSLCLPLRRRKGSYPNGPSLAIQHSVDVETESVVRSNLKSVIAGDFGNKLSHPSKAIFVCRDG